MNIPFQQALACMPPRLRRPLSRLTPKDQAECEEFRLRTGQPLCWVGPEGARPVLEAGVPIPVEQEELRCAVELATQASFHTALEQLCNGFLPLPGGHRMGLCGSAVVRDGRLINLRELSSLSVRIARQVPGVADSLIPRLMGANGLENTLILAPPGQGKTTLLRDLIRGLSSSPYEFRVGLADERGEVASLSNGRPQMDIGEHTDVMDGCPKHLALLMLLRGLNPQVLATDEITAPEDVESMLTAAGCGVSLLATAHGSEVADLGRRPVYRRLLEQGLFRRAILIDRQEGRRSYRVEVLA